jgi:hypothetical protein
LRSVTPVKNHIASPLVTGNNFFMSFRAELTEFVGLSIMLIAAVFAAVVLLQVI